MDFSIDLETQEKARATRQFCEKHIDPYVANWDSGETIATSVFEQMAALGLTSLRIPSENGGELASFVECGSLVYEDGSLKHFATDIVAPPQASGHRDLWIVAYNPWNDRRYGEEFERRAVQSVQERL